MAKINKVRGKLTASRTRDGAMVRKIAELQKVVNLLVDDNKRLHKLIGA